MKTLKAIVFDIDGTLTRKVAWPYLTEKVGGSVEHNDNIFASWERGEITEIRAREKLIENWSAGGKGFKKFWEEFLKEIPLREDAVETVGYLKDRGYKLCMITGSFDIYVQIVGEELGIKDWYANTKIAWDRDGKLADIDTVLDDKIKKAEFLGQYCRTNNLKLEECVPVGDSNNDIGLFEITGNGIAVRTEFEAPELEKIAWKKIDHLVELKNIL